MLTRAWYAQMGGLWGRLTAWGADDILEDFVVEAIGGGGSILRLLDVRCLTMRKLDSLHVVLFFCHDRRCQRVQGWHAMQLVVGCEWYSFQRRPESLPRPVQGTILRWRSIRGELGRGEVRLEVGWRVWRGTVGAAVGDSVMQELARAINSAAAILSDGW